MKRAFAISTLCCFLPLAAAAERPVQVIHGSYAARLSGYCKSVTEKDIQSGQTGDFRVRRGGSLIASGNRHVIFIDAGASATVTGQASIVYVAKGGQATVGGQRNQVFAEAGGKVVILGQANLATVGELDLKINRNAEECQ
jgi:hypothetical protein